jgi:hypothetical protein
MLHQKYGERFVTFQAEQHEINATIKLFENARMIIGSHGGAMYNALWASRRSKVIELMPVRADGRYFRQRGYDTMPPFAHLAIYTNSVMNGQPFYRWYEATRSFNYNVNVRLFAAWLKAVEAECVVCRPKG